jgi:sugar phosphate isomerase/epimerase
MPTRRTFIKSTALWTSCSLAGFALPHKKTIQIGACDWSLGKGSDPGAFELARQIGLKGVMVNMGDIGNNLHLREPVLQQLYLQESKRTGVAITSVALAVLNEIPYKSDPRTEQWVWDSVDVAKALSVKVVLLAFFSANDLRKDEAGKKEVIRRLKKVMPHAERNGILLGIESYLNADEHLAIIRQVGSPNLKVYYDFRNTADAGCDTVKEFKKLGKDLVCELHIKENGHLLGQGTLDWKAIMQAIRETGYTGDGWMQIEGAMPEGAALVDSYKQNLHYLQSIY